MFNAYKNKQSNLLSTEVEVQFIPMAFSYTARKLISSVIHIYDVKARTRKQYFHLTNKR